jgi:hypothetical protein
MKVNLLLLFLFLMLTGKTQDFEVSPIILNFNAEPGESQTKFLNIKNHNNSVQTFILTLSDYSIDSKGQGSYVEAGSMKSSIADWVSISPAFFDLKPNEEKEIAISMQQPADDLGSKWGVIFVRTAQEQGAYDADKTLSAGVTVSARIAVDVYQTPGSNRVFKATISNMNEMSSGQDSIRKFSVLVNNLGDVITNCRAFLIATNIESAEEFPFPELVFTMFPKSSRKVELELPNTLPKGTYSLAAILDYGSKTNLEGTQIMIKVE